MIDCDQVIVECGDIQVVTVCEQGPPGRDGRDGIDGVGADKYYLHTQSVPSTVWVVVHNLNKLPSITAIIDGKNVGARVLHLNANSAEIHFGAPIVGQASCN